MLNSLRILVCFLIILSLTKVGAQQQQNIQTDLPDYTLPSPEATQFTQYGNLDINESSGMAKVDIPLYEYVSGQLKLPISINYAGTGVKVDQASTWTGINWTLNAGGVITRTVHHMPDETVSNRVFAADVEAYNGSSSTSNAEMLYNYFNTQSSWDTQPDIFDFSFPGYSGSFYFDENFDPVLLTADFPLKIEVTGSQSANKLKLAQQKEIKITDPSGIEYFFGGNATEETFTDQDGHNITTPLAVTSFYLTQIKHPKIGSMYFEYISLNYKIAVDQSRTVYRYSPNSNLALQDMSCQSSYLPPNLAMENTDMNTSSTIRYSNVTNGRFLSRIYSPNTSFQVVFNSSTIGNSGYNTKRVLNSINIEDHSNNVYSTFDFDYNFDTGSGGICQRFFLKELVFDQGSGDDKIYEFSYNSPMSLPDRFDSSQDALGYYNGQSNPNGLLPDISAYPSGYDQIGEAFSGVSSNCTADRSTNFNYKKYGTLKKVIYPTGGFTEFEYEAPEAKKLTTDREYLYIRRNMPGFVTPTIASDWFGIGMPYLPGPGEPTPPVGVFKSQQITVYTSISSDTQILHGDKIYVKLTEVNCTNCATPVIKTIMNPVYDTSLPGPYNLYNNFTFNLAQDKQYKLEFYFDTNSGYSTSFEGHLYFDYVMGYELVEGQGLRVKRLTDYQDATDVANIKRYYYTVPENVYNDPINYLDDYKEPMFHEQGTLLARYSLTIGCGEYEAYHVQFCNMVSKMGFSLSIHPVNYNEKVISSYEDVTISHGGDNFEKGGTYKNFYHSVSDVVLMVKTPEAPTFRSSKLSRAHSGSSWSIQGRLHGKLIKESHMRKEGGSLYMVSQDSIGYTTLNYDSKKAYVGHIYAGCGNGYLYEYKNAAYGYYFLNSTMIAQANKETKEFVEPVPIINNITANAPTLMNPDNYNHISHTVGYEYQGLPGLLTKVIKNSSEDTSFLISNYYYANQANQLSGLTTLEQTAYTALVNANQVGAPIQIEHYKDANLLERVRSTYKLVGTRSLLDKVKVEKGGGSSGLEDRIEYVSYNTYGLPAEVRKTGDPSGTVYLWGTVHPYPLAKIDGATYSQVLGVQGDYRVNLPNALVTTYTYYGHQYLLDSVTDPKGDTNTFHYDALGRLQYIKDADDHIVKEHIYNYKD